MSGFSNTAGRVRVPFIAIVAAAGAALSLALVSGLIFTGLAQAEKLHLDHFTAQSTTKAKAEYNVAGGHPYQNYNSFLLKGETVKDAVVTLQPGFFGNPAAAPRCRAENVGQTEALSHCPAGSRIGLAVLHFSTGSDVASPIYNGYPEKGFPAQFVFNILNNIALLTVRPLPRTEAYGLTVGALNLPYELVGGFDTTFYGVPSEHKSGTTDAPFLSNPVNCSEAEPKWGFFGDSWENPGPILPTGQPDFADENWVQGSVTSPPVTGCDESLLANQFNPGLATSLSQGGGAIQADQPSGLAVNFHFPQTNDPTDLSTTFDPALPQAPEPKDITVKLPAGVSLSPSSADGLGACSDQASDPAGDQVHLDSTQSVTCPDSSKIGTAVTTTPLLAVHDPITDEVNGPEPIPGEVFLVKPHAGDLAEGKFRILIQLENADAGTNFKLPGVVVADPQTGQLTATFTDNPQLPAKDLTVEFKSGPRAPLASPPTCGSFQTTSTLVPWSTPGTPDAHPTASFDVSTGANGGGCASSPGARPFSPALSAGAGSNKAGAYSPFVFKVTRQDGEQELNSLDVTTPPGFSAKIAGVPSCSDAAIAAAKAKSGAEEQANPTCPASSQIGSVTVGAGPGSNPYYTSGRAYLAGPYKGAPLSLVFITPAVAGPFDLGNTVVRAATFLNSETTQITVKTDPLPQILDGVPLRLRSLSTTLDRSNFTLNPTDCNAMSVNATISGSNGASSSPSQPFQAGDCGALDFKPGLKLALKGKVSRRSHPSLTATLNPRPGDANIASAQVRLPKAAFLDNDNIGQVCTRPQFSAHQCPAGSIYGKATATTPLLGYPLAGPVYLRANPAHKLPDLVVGFNGPASQPIEIELAGKTDSVKGALRNTFEAVPDVPVSSFQLELFGGKKGLIEMSTGFCSNPKAAVLFTGQNGKVTESAPKVAAKCPKKKKSKKGKGGKHKRAGAHSRG